jgi:hypothetical protein
VKADLEKGNLQSSLDSARTSSIAMFLMQAGCASRVSARSSVWLSLGLSHKSATVRWIGALGNIFGVYVNRYLRKILSFSLYLWDSRVNLQYHEPSLILEDLQLELVESFIPPNFLLNNMSLN